jgi:hypothetical protein
MPNPQTYKCDDCDFHVLADEAGEDARADHALEHPDHRIGITDCLPSPP